MKKLLLKFAQFMYGRYTKVDSISWTAIIVGLSIGVFGVFIPNLFARLIIEVFRVGLMVYAIYRPFSKAVWKRDAENRKWSALLYKIKNWFLLIGRRVKFIKTSVFAVCPHCKAQIKLPRKKGNHTVKCPRCRQKFDIKVYWGKKQPKKQ